MRVAVAALGFMLISSRTTVWAEDDNTDNLQPLKSDVSRAALFARVKAAADAEPNPGPGIPFDLRQFSFPHSADFDGNVPRKNSYFGVDVSHYQDSAINFSLFKSQRILFVYAKATQGAHYKDDHFAGYYAALAKLKSDAPNKAILKGAYHFLSSNSSESGKLQADTFVNFVNHNGGFSADDLPPVVDLEWDVATSNGSDRWADHDAKREILPKVKEFIEQVKTRTNRTPIVYTALSWWKGRGLKLTDIADLGDVKFWLADYSQPSQRTEAPKTFPVPQPLFWQFSESAVITQGYRKPLDASVLKGTKDDFRAMFGVDLP